MNKTVIIGAGSLTFSSRLMADILSYKDMGAMHFVLVDIDETRLGYAGRIADRIIREGHYDQVTYRLHTDRGEALKDADAVIVAILVGGPEAIKLDIDIPMSYGVDQCIGDTLTPGGIMRCLRTLPEMVSIARDVMDYAPEAWVLNYTNPMAMLTWGMFQAVPGIQLVGLCHSVQGAAAEWAKRLNIPRSELDFDCAGLNHQAWFTRMEAHSEDLLPRVRALCTRQDIWNSDTVRMEYVKHFGFPVTESSGHVSEYSPWVRKRPELIQRYCPRGGGDWNGGHGFIKELYSQDRKWEEEMERMASGEKDISLERSGEYASQIIHALLGGSPVTIHGNVLNDGWIDNLPRRACVEVACRVDEQGIHPRHYGALPLHLAAINRVQVNVQELAIEAALKADPERVFQAMCMDPLTGACLSLDEIRRMTRELMQAQARWIPQFNGRLPEKKKELFFDATVSAEQHVDPGQAH